MQARSSRLACWNPLRCCGFRWPTRRGTGASSPSNCCGDDGPAALAEADAAVAGSFAPTAENDFVAVFQEAALLAVGQVQRFRAAPGYLQQAPAILLFRPGDRAAADQVAGAEVASVGSVMRHHLAERP